MHAAVTVHMDAEPLAVWELLSDITRMGSYSPEVFEAEWLGGATGPTLGARYRGHVKRNERGPIYWTVCEITDCVPGEVFEFAVMMGQRRIVTWRYELRPAAGGGVDVTESFRLIESPLASVYWALGGFLRVRRNRRDMRTTLERIRAVAEA
jgi:hypothetical protein